MRTTLLPARGRSLRLVILAVAALVLSGCAFVFLAQTEVSGAQPVTTRTCGSAFDSVVDRSGWQLWWARDLEESDDAVRSALVRTTLCPGAINHRIGVSALLGGTGAVLALLARRLARPTERDASAAASFGREVARLGTVTSMVGAVLTIAGMIAIIVLVADGDSTLFLYTDRLVVAVVGLIVLMPTLALLVIGRALTLGGAYLDGPDGDQEDG